MTLAALAIIVRSRLFMTLIVIAQCVIFINALGHILGSLIFFDYSPGVATAILHIVPFSIMFFRQLIRQKEFSMKGIALFRVIGIVLMYPLILLFLFIAGLL